ncbi:MAG: enoyl-CoA hydratase/isomerase family protein [Burkholderiales bacterium]|nr:enoyl-CoA hydratase/isomerase family protein [Burkholderiales bacterium]
MISQMLVERRGPTLVLTLSDPATRNSLSPQALATGIDALAAAGADTALRGVVLRGEGGHFCAGGNVRRLAATRQIGPDEQIASMARFHGFVDALRRHPLPVIAAVEGFAAGGGAALALACDLVVAAEDAQFVLSYGRIGLSPDGGSSWHLARLLPRGLALQMMWLPEPMSAREWQRLGLVQQLCPSGQALDAALALAERLAAMAPNAIASAKALVEAAPGRALPEQLDAERDHFVRNLFHRNGGEGLQAFLDKRPPRYES